MADQIIYEIGEVVMHRRHGRVVVAERYTERNLENKNKVLLTLSKERVPAADISKLNGPMYVKNQVVLVGREPACVVETVQQVGGKIAVIGMGGKQSRVDAVNVRDCPEPWFHKDAPATIIRVGSLKVGSKVKVKSDAGSLKRIGPVMVEFAHPDGRFETFNVSVGDLLPGG